MGSWVLIALLAAIAPHPQAPVQLRDVKLPAGVNRKWLQADCDLIWQIRRALPPDPDRPGLVGLTGNVSPPEDVALGFGMARHTQRAGGGYMSCDITSVTQAHALVSLQVDCWAGSAKAALARPIFERALGEGFTRLEQKLSPLAYQAKFTFPEADRRARAELDAQLGPLAPVTVPPALASAYAKLMSAQEGLAVGTGCGDGGGPPEGAEAAAALRSARRFDLVRNVLRGPNPEARVYAMSILEDLRASDDQDRIVIERLRALPIKIMSCMGCSYGRDTLDEALRALR